VERGLNEGGGGGGGGGGGDERGGEEGSHEEISSRERNRSLPPSRDNHAVLWRINFGAEDVYSWRMQIRSSISIDRPVDRRVERSSSQTLLSILSRKNARYRIAFDRSRLSRNSTRDPARAREKKQRETRGKGEGGGERE